jgi:hypothetical protein
VLAAMCRRWTLTQPPVPLVEVLKRMIVPVSILAAAGIGNGLRFADRGFFPFAVAAGVAISLTLGVGLIGLGILAKSPVEGRSSG